jgi:hypothetical protein
MTTGQADGPREMSSSRVQASRWEADLHDYLTSHLTNEADIASEYGELAQDTTFPAFAYLAAWILEDERRHHRVFADLARSIRAMAELDRAEDAIPSLHGPAAERERIVASTNRFLNIEREDARELRQLRRRLRHIEKTSLLPFLVRLMQDDTRKHIRILKFVRSHARKLPTERSDTR